MKTMSRRQQKKERMRGIIVKAAHEAFQSQPYDRVNMDDVAEKALLSRATLYNYFDNKESLYLEAGLEGWKQMQKVVPPLMDTVPTGLEKIMILIPIGFHGVLEDPTYYEILRRFMENNNEAETPIETAYNALTEKQRGTIEQTGETVNIRYFHELMGYVDIWRRAIETGQKDGSIRHDVPANHLTQIVFMYINGAMEQLALNKNALMNINLPVMDAIRIMTNNLKKILQP